MAKVTIVNYVLLNPAHLHVVLVPFFICALSFKIELDGWTTSHDDFILAFVQNIELWFEHYFQLSRVKILEYPMIVTSIPEHIT
jgi:hypothetical protein